MPADALKCKIVSFRIADEEYLRIEELAKNSGFTSVSYFAREATLKGSPLQPANVPVNVHIERLGSQLEALTLSIDKGIAQLRAMLGMPNTCPDTFDSYCNE